MDGWIPDGTIVGDRWRIIGRLGEGGFGRVLLAEDVSALALGRAAVKVLHPDTSPRERQAFLDEVKKMAVLRHQNLVGYLDSGLLRFDGEGLPDGLGEIRPFLVTELCEHSLQDRLEATAGGRLPVGEARPLLADVAGGLAHLHQRGMIHRDIKPGNVLVADGRWKLADFGLTRDLTATGTYHLGDLLVGASPVPPWPGLAPVHQDDPTWVPPTHPTPTVGGGGKRRWPLPAGAVAVLAVLAAAAVGLIGLLPATETADGGGALRSGSTGEDAEVVAAGDDATIGDDVSIGYDATIGSTPAGDPGGDPEPVPDEATAVPDPLTHFATVPCSAGPGTVTELTNRFSSPVDYVISLDHLDADGTWIAQSYESVRRLQPRETALVDLTSSEEGSTACELVDLTAVPTAAEVLAADDLVDIVSCDLDEFFGNWYDITYTVENPNDFSAAAEVAFGIVDANGVRIDESTTNLTVDIGPGQRVREETSTVFWTMDRTDRVPVRCIVTWASVGSWP